MKINEELKFNIGSKIIKVNIGWLFLMLMIIFFIGIFYMAYDKISENKKYKYIVEKQEKEEIKRELQKKEEEKLLYEENSKKLQNIINNKTKVFAYFSLTGTTTEDTVKVDIKLENISELTINQKSINVKGINFLQHKINLFFGDNFITIIGSNNNIKKEIKYSIKRILKDESCLFPGNVCYKKIYEDLSPNTDFQKVCENEGLNLVSLEDLITDFGSMYNNFIIRNIETGYFPHEKVKALYGSSNLIKGKNIRYGSVVKYIEENGNLFFDEVNISKEDTYIPYIYPTGDYSIKGIRSDILWTNISDKKFNNNKITILCYKKGVQNNEKKYKSTIFPQKKLELEKKEDFEYISGYKPGGDSIIKQLTTGLEWQSDGLGMDWYSAKIYCEDLVLNGKSNWRLPTKSELEGILIYNKNYDIFSYSEYFIFKVGGYWSSTKDGIFNGMETMYLVGNLGVFSAIKSTEMYVRCVSSH